MICMLSQIATAREFRRETSRLVQHLLPLRMPYPRPAAHVLLSVKCTLAWVVLSFGAFASFVLLHQRRPTSLLLRLLSAYTCILDS